MKSTRPTSKAKICTVNTYSGRAGFSTPAPTPGTVTAKFSDLPDATYTSPITSSTSVPFADGTRSDCNKYFDGDTFQKGVAGTNWNSECQLAAAVYDVDLADFGVWNTGESRHSNFSMFN